MILIPTLRSQRQTDESESSLVYRVPRESRLERENLSRKRRRRRRRRIIHLSSFIQKINLESVPSHQENFFLQQMKGDHYRKLQPIKMHNCEAQSQWIHLQNISTPKAQEALKKMEQKDCKI